jgi:asparagine N-glycosylation enzyme membrane subunit Stt3
MVAIIQQVRRRVLAVPVAALLAGAGGGYAVAVLDGGRREVPVRPGLYDELAGLVEVTAAGLAAGQTVEVPAS